MQLKPPNTIEMINEYSSIHENKREIKPIKNLNSYMSLPKIINDNNFSIMKDKNYNDYVMFEFVLRSINELKLSVFYDSLVYLKNFLNKDTPDNKVI